MNRTEKLSQQMKAISKEITKTRNQIKHGTTNGYSSGKKLSVKALDNRKLKLKKLDKKFEILSKRYQENLVKERSKQTSLAHKKYGFGSRG